MGVESEGLGVRVALVQGAQIQSSGFRVSPLHPKVPGKEFIAFREVRLQDLSGATMSRPRCQKPNLGLGLGV